MVKRILPSNRWLLRTSTDFFRRLERENGSMVSIGDEVLWGLKRARFIVPKEIEVYMATNYLVNHHPELEPFKQEIFYTTLPSEESVAYLSLVDANSEGGLNFCHNTGELLKYPWFSKDLSSRLADDILNKRRVFTPALHLAIREKHPYS